MKKNSKDIDLTHDLSENNKISGFTVSFDDIRVTYDISPLQSSAERLEQLLKNENLEILNFEAVIDLLISEKIHPLIGEKVLRQKIHDKMILNDAIERLAIGTLGENLGREYLKSYLCEINPHTDKKWDSLASLDDRKQCGAKTVMFQIIDENSSCLECKSRNGSCMAIDDAILFENAYNHSCAYQWVTFSGGEEHLLSIDEMTKAGIPHGGYLVSMVKPLVKSETPSETLTKIRAMLVTSLQCYSSPWETASVYRLIGDIDDYSGNKQLALKNYESALNCDEKVGVKRKISQLKKLLAE